MKILVTGAAGFIGSELCIKLIERGDNVIGIDNHNSYYDPNLKEARIARHLSNKNYTHLRLDISDKDALEDAFNKYCPTHVVNLAAQAGVRYSIENPNTYIQSNIAGFLNILECCRHQNTKHLVYASSSSVYGANTKMPFSVHDNVDHPLSLYAVSKKSNELMAHNYSHLFQIPTTGLRFFTVYGPWGRPDMALYKFTKAIIANEPITVFNFGNHRRDFTFIDDIVHGIIKVINRPAVPNADWTGNSPDPSSSFAPWRVFNIGNNRPVELLDFIKAIEAALGIKAKLEMAPLQEGDVESTFADIEDFHKEFGVKPTTHIDDGIKKFVDWYLDYYEVE